MPAAIAAKNDSHDRMRSTFPISKRKGVRLAQVHFDMNSTQLSTGRSDLLKKLLSGSGRYLDGALLSLDFRIPSDKLTSMNAFLKLARNRTPRHLGS